MKTRIISKPSTFNNSVFFLHIALAAARDLFNMYSLQYLNVLNLAVRWHGGYRDTPAHDSWISSGWNVNGGHKSSLQNIQDQVDNKCDIYGF